MRAALCKQSVAFLLAVLSNGNLELGISYSTAREEEEEDEAETSRAVYKGLH